MSWKYIIGLGIICLFIPQIGFAAAQCLTNCAISDLAITIIDNPDPVNAGKTLTYNVTANNFGPQSANQVVFTLVLPSSVSYQSGPAYCTEFGGTITCPLGAMPVGSQILDFSLYVDPASTGYIGSAGTIQNLDPSSSDPVPGNNNTNISTFVMGPTLAISINDIEINEPNANTADAVFTVSLSQFSSFEVTVDYSTADNTAVAGSDYFNTTGTLTFPPNTIEKQISIPILADSETVEGTESFFVDLTNPTFAVIADSQGIGQITDPCLFCDHFDDNILRSDWTYMKPCWIENGHTLIGTPCSSRRTITIASPTFAGAAKGTVEAYMQSAGGPGNTLWLFAWYQDKKNTVELIMKEEKKYLGAETETPWQSCFKEKSKTTH